MADLLLMHCGSFKERILTIMHAFANVPKVVRRLFLCVALLFHTSCGHEQHLIAWNHEMRVLITHHARTIAITPLLDCASSTKRSLTEHNIRRRVSHGVQLHETITRKLLTDVNLVQQPFNAILRIARMGT